MSKISVIIPVIGNPPYLERCLESIRSQDYPQDKVEIILSVGDYWQSVVSGCGTTFWLKYHTEILENPHHTAEKGKQLALCKATGDYICFLDSDNVLTNLQYFTQAIELLETNNSLLGIEASYTTQPEMTSLCKYLTSILHISDPVSLALTTPPYCHGLYKNVGLIYSRHPSRKSYPLGANGFIFRRKDLYDVGAQENFEDTEIANKIDKHIWIRIPAVAHYYTSNIWHFICKRRRQTFHYLSRPVTTIHWASNKKSDIFWILIAHATLLVPLIATFNMYRKHKQLCVLWHPIASFASVIGLMWGVLTYKLSTNIEEHKLQP
jgi:glycosyltransferase involved in cell wall biosynthesis